MIRMKRMTLAALFAVLSGCAVGPDYRQPVAVTGDAFKQIARLSQAQRTDDPANRGWVPVDSSRSALAPQWWLAFDDTTLDGLMARLNADNLTIAQAEAQYRRAQAALQQTRAGFFPTLGGNASVTRSGTGAGDTSSTGNDYSVSGAVSWEPDLWGRVRRSVQGSQAALQASAADVAAVRLSLQSTLAQTYFRVLSADAQARLLDSTVNAYARSLAMVENRLRVGTVPQSDVEAARTQLENARARLLAQQRDRAQLENALAVLLGVPPSSFSLSGARSLPSVPTVPVGLPAQLLQRRPDVVAQERRVAQANAQIGVAQAAWFPDLTLSAQAGFRSGQWAQWLTAPASFWALGPALALTLFDGGAREAQLQDARAAYDEAVAGYRQTVLDALREVEDYLVALDLLGQEQRVQERALTAARSSLRLTQNQFDAGLIDYLSVVQVETAAFDAEREALGLQLDRLLAGVQLVTALGGGWEASSSPGE